MTRRLISGVALAVAVVLAGCGGSATRGTATPSGSLSDLQVLAPSAVPGIPYTTRAVSASDLAKDAPIPGLQSKIASWGYLGGRQRTFQGESRHLTLVISRSLAFRDSGGANRFVGFVHSQATAFFGGGVTEQSLTAQGRAGWMFGPAPCACHMASPVQIAVLDAGAEVVWLEINGPDANATLLMSLLDPQRNTAV